MAETPRHLLSTEPHTEIRGDESYDLKGSPSDIKKTGAWRAAPFFFGIEFGDTVGHLAIAFNLVPYLVINLHQSNAYAATTFQNFMGTSYILPTIGAFIADSYLGRYWTIAVGSVIYAAGLLLLTLSTAITSLKPQECTPTLTQPCQPAHGKVIAVFFAAIYLVTVGAAGVKPCVPSMGGDQFDESIPEEKIQRPKYFNLLFWALQAGSLLVLTVIVYIQDNQGRTWGFGVPSVIFVITVLIFFAGTPFYRHKKPAGSGFTRMAQVFVASLRKAFVTRPADTNALYDSTDKNVALKGRKLAHTRGFRFLDNAAVVRSGDFNPDGTPTSPWKLCSVSQVEETKRVLHVLPIWLTTIIPYCLFAQIFSYTVIQSITMDRHLGPNFQVPYASFSAFSFIFASILLPIYDPVLMPFLRKFTGNPKGISTLTRMAVGLFISIFSMISAALVENKRKDQARRASLLDNPLLPVPISAFWLVPQVVLLGATEVFLSVGQLDFFYEEMPDGMRAMGTAFFCSSVSVGYFISSFMVTTVTRATRHGSYGGWLAQNLNRGDLQNFYWTLAVMSVVNLAFFLLAAKLYSYKRVDSVPRLEAVRFDPARDSVDSTSSIATAPRTSDVQLLKNPQLQSDGSSSPWLPVTPQR